MKENNIRELQYGVLMRTVDNLAFDYGNTLVPDPFREILKRKSSSIVKIIESEKEGISEIGIISAWTEANEETDFPHVSHFYQETGIVRNALARLEIQPKSSLVSKLLSTYREGFKEQLKSSWKLKETCRVVLDLGTKVQCVGVLSNERKESLRRGLSYSGLFKLFDFVLSSEEIGYEKPDAAFFEVAISQLHLAPERTLYVGDDPARDISPASKAGMKTALLVRPEHESMPWRDYGKMNTCAPDYTIHSISDIREIFSREHADR